MDAADKAAAAVVAAAAVATTDGEKVYGRVCVEADVVEAGVAGTALEIRSTLAERLPGSMISDFPSDSKPETDAPTFGRRTEGQRRHIHFGRTTNRREATSRRRRYNRNRLRSFESRRRTCSKFEWRRSTEMMKRTKAISVLSEEGEGDRRKPRRGRRRRRNEDRTASCLRKCCRGWNPRTSAECTAAWVGAADALLAGAEEGRSDPTCF